MPSQIEQLPDFRGYLKTASSQAWLRVSFGPMQSGKGETMPNHDPCHDDPEDLSLENGNPETSVPTASTSARRIT